MRLSTVEQPAAKRTQRWGNLSCAHVPNFSWIFPPDFPRFSEVRRNQVGLRVAINE